MSKIENEYLVKINDKIVNLRNNGPNGNQTQNTTVKMQRFEI